MGIKNKLPMHKKYCDWMDKKFGNIWNHFSASVKFDWWLHFLEEDYFSFYNKKGMDDLLKKIHSLEEEIYLLKNKKRVVPKGGKGINVWGMYSRCFRFVYKTEPIRNAMTNKLCCTLVDRLGEDDAILVAKFYLKQRDAFYVKNTHHLRFCVQDCETLATKMKTGLTITNKSAKNVERASHNAQVTQNYLKEKHGGTN